MPKTGHVIPHILRFECIQISLDDFLGESIRAERHALAVVMISSRVPQDNQYGESKSKRDMIAPHHFFDSEEYNLLYIET